MTRAPLVILLSLLVAACGDREDQPSANIVQDDELPVIPDVVPAKGCAAEWKAALDPESFAHNGADRRFLAERLEEFRKMAEESIRLTVDAACKDGAVDPAKAQAITTVILFSASGAPGPVFAAGPRPGTLNLESPFAEDNLAIPAEMELRAGLVCWTDPKGEDCAAMEP